MHGIYKGHAAVLFVVIALVPTVHKVVLCSMCHIWQREYLYLKVHLSGIFQGLEVTFFLINSNYL